MRRLQGLLLLITAASTAGCLPGQRSTARVTEIESHLGAGGASSSMRVEIDYRPDGRIDEITRTWGGDFVDRWELVYDQSGRAEELVVESDGGTLRVELKFKGELLTDATARADGSDNETHWDLSYINDDPRFVESIVVTQDQGSGFVEDVKELRYDDRSRIEEITSTAFSHGNGDSRDLGSTKDVLRWDAQSGRLARITTTTETPYYPEAASDWCWDAGYYGDGICDSCPQPDPDCGATTTPVAPGTGEPEMRKNTSLYSMRYDDKGRLEELNAPGGAKYEVSYDDEERIEEIELRTDASTFLVEYRYDAGDVRGHSFTPVLPLGELFDLAGASFGTLPFESPMDFVNLLAGATAAPSNSGP